MKQIIQNYRKGTLALEEVPDPICKSSGVLVKTHFSAVSVGTEKIKLENASMNYLQMAKAKPDQVKQILTTLHQLGPVATYRKVMNKLDSMTPLGYSCAGEVIEVGRNVPDIKVGDLVACAGGGYANHAEINYVPRNLVVKIPNGVDLESASFATIGAIAMQGFRRTGTQIGETIAVIGLGLIGQILVQIIAASGCRAFGFDIDESKNKIALENGAVWTAVPELGITENVVQMSGGYGVDAVILATGTRSNVPIEFSAAIARDRARVVDIGITKMDIPWEPYYMKEMEVRMSRSYGPGRYDHQYEEDGVDYPIGYVRWTEQRNIEAILNLLQQKKIDFQKLITHRFVFKDAEEAYRKIEKGEDNFLGVTFLYDKLKKENVNTVELRTTPLKKAKVSIGVIGAGNFAKTMLLPFLRKEKEVVLDTVATATGISAKDTASKFDFRKACTDYKQILNNQTVNTVMILTRHSSHAAFVTESLASGKNVYVEKPLCVNIQDLPGIEDALMHSGCILMVGYNRRFSPAIKKLKELIYGLGVPFSVHYRVNAGFIPSDHWYQQPENGGRIIGEGCHFVDTLQFLTGSHPVSVYAAAVVSNDKSMPDQDNIVANIQFENGSVGTIEYVSDGDKNYPKEQIVVTGGRSNIFFDNFREIVLYRNGKTKKYAGFKGSKGHKEEMKVFVQSVISGKMPISWESLKLTSLATQAIMDSQRERRMIVLDRRHLTELTENTDYVLKEVKAN